MTIVTVAYKPTYNWGAPHCMIIATGRCVSSGGLVVLLAPRAAGCPAGAAPGAFAARDAQGLGARGAGAAGGKTWDTLGTSPWKVEEVTLQNGYLTVMNGDFHGILSWFNGILMGYTPSGYVNIAIEAMAIEIVDLSIEHGDFPDSYVNVYQRVDESDESLKWHLRFFFYWNNEDFTNESIGEPSRIEISPYKLDWEFIDANRLDFTMNNDELSGKNEYQSGIQNCKIGLWPSNAI